MNKNIVYALSLLWQELENVPESCIGSMCDAIMALEIIVKDIDNAKGNVKLKRKELLELPNTKHIKGVN